MSESRLTLIRGSQVYETLCLQVDTHCVPWACQSHAQCLAQQLTGMSAAIAGRCELNHRQPSRLLDEQGLNGNLSQELAPGTVYQMHYWWEGGRGRACVDSAAEIGLRQPHCPLGPGQRELRE